MSNSKYIKLRLSCSEYASLRSIVLTNDEMPISLKKLFKESITIRDFLLEHINTYDDEKIYYICCKPEYLKYKNRFVVGEQDYCTEKVYYRIMDNFTYFDDYEIEEFVKDMDKELLKKEEGK